MIDEETERAVEAWVRLGDELIQTEAADDRASCTRCGSRFRVLDGTDAALCARCYLERGGSNESSR